MKKSTKSTKTTRSRKTKNAPRRSVLQVSTQSAATGQPVGLPAGAILLFGGLCLVVLGWAVYLGLSWVGNQLFVRNDRFVLDTIEIKTDGVMPEDVLVERAKVKKGSNLFDLTLPEVRRRLEAHPKIKEARVRRYLPDRLAITVSERVPLARLGRTFAGQNWLVSADGLLIQKSGRSKNLPFLKGVGFNLGLGDSVWEGPAQEALEYLEILMNMPGHKRELLAVREISVGHPDYLDWRLSNGYQLLMPRNGDFVEKLEEASRAIHREETQSGGPRNRVFDLTLDAPHLIGAPL